jgi:hypothetical protein
MIATFIKVKNTTTQKVVLHLCVVWKDKTKIRKLMPYLLRDKYGVDSHFHEILYYDFWDDQLVINVYMVALSFFDFNFKR